MKSPLPKKVSEFSDYSFRYYTTQKTLKNVLSREGAYFFVSNYSVMNDQDEAKLHENEKDRIHSLCFSNTDNESIPMWYLYSGLLGKGACLRFTPSLMMDFIKTIDIIHPVREDYSVNTDIELKNGIDFEIKFGWVFYFDKGQDLFYRNKWYRIEDSIDAFFSQNYFLKKYPWYYEREFRIVIINKSDSIHNKFAVPIKDNIISSKNLSIILAPESQETDETFWLERGFNTKKSDMNISMSLLARNREEIYSYISDAIDCYSKSVSKF